MSTPCRTRKSEVSVSGESRYTVSLEDFRNIQYNKGVVWTSLS